MMKQRVIMAFGILVLFTILDVSINTHFVAGQENGSNHTVEISSDVLSALNSSEWASVYIVLILKNDTVMDSIISNLSTSEFKFQEKLLRGDAFAGNITKEGLDTLANNPNVRTIYFNRVGYTLDNETNHKTNIETKEVKFPKTIWWAIIPALTILVVIFYILIDEKR